MKAPPRPMLTRSSPAAPKEPAPVAASVDDLFEPLPKLPQFIPSAAPQLPGFGRSPNAFKLPPLVKPVHRPMPHRHGLIDVSQAQLQGGGKSAAVRFRRRQMAEPRPAVQSDAARQMRGILVASEETAAMQRCNIPQTLRSRRAAAAMAAGFGAGSGPLGLNPFQI